jgi:hypothetical protein
MFRLHISQQVSDQQAAQFKTLVSPTASPAKPAGGT